MENPDLLQVYLVSDEYWFIASGHHDALEQYRDITGCDEDEVSIEDVSLVSDRELATLVYTEDEIPVRSFTEQVAKLKSENRWSRGVFAIVHW